MTTLVKARTLLAHLFALTLGFLVVVSAYITQPVVLVMSSLQPRVEKPNDVEAAPHKKEIELPAFDTNKDEHMDLSDLVESPSEFHRKGAARIKKAEKTEDLKYCTSVPLPPSDSEEEKALQTRPSLWDRRRGLPKQFPVRDEDSLPAGRPTRDDPKDKGDSCDCSGEDDLRVDPSIQEELDVLDSIPVPRGESN